MMTKVLSFARTLSMSRPGLWRNSLFSLLSPLVLIALLLALCAAGSAHAQSKPDTTSPVVTPIPGPDAAPPPPEDPEVMDDSVIVSFSAPTSMTTGTAEWVIVTVKNTGNTTWSSNIDGPYRLGIFNPLDSQIWGIGRVAVTGSVAPNSQATFAFAIVAPTTPGTYSFDWRMLREGKFWFGAIATRTITVSAPAPVYDAQLTNATVPANMTAGSTYNVSLTFKNTGNVTWSRAENYRIGSTSPVDNVTFGRNRVDMNVATVAPGQSATFDFQVQAPATTGNHVFDWGMLWEGQRRFGQTTARTVTVSAPIPKPVIAVDHIPAPVAGSNFTTYWSASNATSLTRVCTAGGTGYKVSESLAVSGNRTQTAQAAWVGYPSTCTWTASGAGGTTTRVETMTTAPAPTPKPVISVSRNPSPVAGQSFTTSWSTSNATSLSRVCTAAGTGYKVNETLAVNGSRTETAQAAWVGYPSSCTWTASGAGGTTTYSETMSTGQPKPTVSVTRTPSPVAGQTFTTTWSTSYATSLSRVCTASGTGYTVNESLAVNDSRTEFAQAGWVAYPSSCTWTATGTGGSTTYTETMTTTAASTPKPTVAVTRTPSPVAGQSFTTTWSTTNATSLSRVCTASGTGYTVNESLAVNGSRTETAQAGWVGYPSSCTWTAGGTGGTSTHVETMTTTAPASSGVTYLHTDALGSPVARSNTSGQVISRTRYEPYGYVASGAVPTLGFTGHVNDADTGLTYMQQRYYDPVAGRFLSIDPVTTDEDTGNGFNRYSYAENNPYSYVDPDGRESDPVQTVTVTAKRPTPVFWIPIQSSKPVDPLIKPWVGQNSGVSQTGSPDWEPDDDDPRGRSRSSSRSRSGKLEKKEKSVNQLNSEIKQGQAPKGMKRVDTGKITGEQTHVHFKDGSALNKDGSWKHGQSHLSNEAKKWLTDNGWTLPK